MSDIHISQILVEQRRKRGVTQEALASYLGVTKSSVSKWETGLSYPDITLLPQIAEFFQITVDELIGYAPQMSKEEIRREYRRLSGKFASAVFEEAMDECRRSARKYKTCYPLLFYIGCIFLNNAHLAPSPERVSEVYSDAMALFVRVKQDCDDPMLSQEALMLEGTCLSQLGKLEEAAALLSGVCSSAGTPESILTMVYQRMGDAAKAEETVQVGIYKNLLSLCELLVCYASFPGLTGERYQAIVSRLRDVSDAFDLSHLHPNYLTISLVTAQGWAALGQEEKVLDALAQYVRTALNAPICLHGDGFFTRVDSWIRENLELQCDPPREESIIRREIVTAVTHNPAFASLSSNRKFRDLAAELEKLQ